MPTDPSEHGLVAEDQGLSSNTPDLPDELESESALEIADVAAEIAAATPEEVETLLSLDGQRAADRFYRLHANWIDRILQEPIVTESLNRLAEIAGLTGRIWSRHKLKLVVAGIMILIPTVTLAGIISLRSTDNTSSTTGQSIVQEAVDVVRQAALDQVDVNLEKTYQPGLYIGRIDPQPEDIDLP